ncbi:multimerin-1 [Rhinophrynus dorsalis]
MKLTLIIILLNIGKGSTRGDSLNITEEPWIALAATKAEEIFTSVGDSSQEGSTISPTQNTDEITTLQYSTIMSGDTLTTNRKEFKDIEENFKAPTETPLPTETGSKENIDLSTEPAAIKNNTRSKINDVTRKVVIAQQGAAMNRSPRHNYNTRVSNQKASFETTRGKNWCAYVHTRLSPTVEMDNVKTYASAGVQPCGWNVGACSGRSRTISQPVYRIRHKIVTSLEWKCCPGYSGEQCQVKGQQVQLQDHGSQSESSLTANTVDSGDKRTTTTEDTGSFLDTLLEEKGKTNDGESGVIHQKLSDQIHSQDMKLSLLKKQVENISFSMSDVHKSLYSLEEKINEDNKATDIQSLLKDLKSKSITELIKDIVKDQFAEFQMDMQESIAQLYKSMSGISIELERNKEVIKELNDTIISSNHKCILEQENKPTMDDVLELKNRIEHLKNTAFVCTTSFTELETKHVVLEKELEQERSRNVMYFESLNKTMSKMKEIHEQLLSGEHDDKQLDHPLINPSDDNITEYLLTLQDRVKKQNIMMLQLYDDINAQDSKINNLTITLELQKNSIEKACEDRFSSCKDDFQKQLKGTEEYVNVLNKTVSDVVLPLDDKIGKMNEQISDLCYDMELLQPFIEKGAPFSMTIEYEHQTDVGEVKQQLKNLTSVLNYLSSRVQELSKGQEGLRNDTQIYEQVFERRINECLTDVEDGLNKTMDIINDAVDSIRDNYMLKSDMGSVETESMVSNATLEKLESLLSEMPLYIQMNESLQSLVSEIRTMQADLVFSPFFVNLSQKVEKIISILVQNQFNITQMEEKLQLSDMDLKSCQSRLQTIESQVNMILANPTTSPKSKKDEVITKEKLQQELYSRIKALEFKSIRLSASFPSLNKTAYEAKGLCQTVFITVRKVNESVPQLIKAVQPNITSLQRGFEELIKSLIEVKTETILSNVTTYVDKTMSDVTSNVAKLQKQMKVSLKKTVPPKKISTDATVLPAGRSQRNSDITDPEEYSSCSSSPCNNGGTCINDKNSFVCACRHPFGGVNCSLKMSDENAQPPDFSKGSYRYAPIVAFFVSHTYGMTSPGPIRFNNLYVNYGSSYTPGTGKFRIPYLGVYVFKYTIESFSPRVSGYLVVDGIDKIAFQSENINSNMYSDRIITGDALLELNYGQEVWLRLATGSIPAQFPPVTTFSGYLLYRT